MVKGNLYQIRINITDPATSFPFYKELFEYLQYKTIEENNENIRFTNGISEFWLINTQGGYENTKYSTDLNRLDQLTFILQSKEEVDLFYRDLIVNKNRYELHGPPDYYPDYPDYYTVFFRGPDNIKIEIMYRSF
jgi:hypothetical protein